jgi:hypothetical protein
MSNGAPLTLRSALSTATDLGARTVDSLVTLARLAAAGIPARPAKAPRKGSRLLVLGSGPSLARSLAEVGSEELRELDLLCVNDFYKEASFATLKPGMLVIADPAYWDELCFDEYGGPISVALERVDWPLLLFVPARARGTRLHRALMERSINFTFFPTTAVRGYRLFESWLFAARIGMPRPQNVLVAAIAIGMWAGFTEIGIIGADHSWHQEISVDVDNLLLASARHNYSTAVQRRPFVKPQGVWKLREGQPLARADVFTMREILNAWAMMHDSYERLSQLAARRKVHVVNCSAMSFIDAFERTALIDFVRGVERATPVVA